MDKQTALRLLKDLNQSIEVDQDFWTEIPEETFLIILNNYIKVE